MLIHIFARKVRKSFSSRVVLFGLHYFLLASAFAVDVELRSKEDVSTTAMAGLCPEFTIAGALMSRAQQKQLFATGLASHHFCTAVLSH